MARRRISRRVIRLATIGLVAGAIATPLIAWATPSWAPRLVPTSWIGFEVASGVEQPAMRMWLPWETRIDVDPDNFDPPIFGEPQFFDRNLRAIERVLATTRFGPWTQFQTTNSVYVLRKHGMPFRAFSSWEVQVGGPGAGKIEHFSSIELPIGYLGKRVDASLRPLPLGLTANILTWSVVSFAVLEGAHALRRLVRRRQGRCVACGYPRHGLNAADPCPKCAAKPAAASTPIDETL